MQGDWLSIVLRDPKLMNYILLMLYFMNSIRWAVFGSWADAIYWFGALLIVGAVSFGMKH